LRVGVMQPPCRAEQHRRARRAPHCGARTQTDFGTDPARPRALV
jgi:hypothetical protein